MGDAGATERFAALVGGTAEPALDEACFLIAAHARPELDIKSEMASLDRLAAACDDATFEGWRRHLFVDFGFVGNVSEYHDPDNSFLDRVLARRTGLPITLAVVGIEVARRLGVPVVGVGMPGHFLLRHEGDPGQFVDAFAGGQLLDAAGCEKRFRAIFGAEVTFDPSLLEAASARAILSRILANLRTEYARRGDLMSLAWVMRLRVTIPGIPAEERRQLAEVLARSGQFSPAADELERWAAGQPDDATEALHKAAMLRARLN